MTIDADLPTNLQSEALLSMGQFLNKLLAGLHRGLLEEDSDAYTYEAFSGSDMGMNSELVLLFALGGPSYTKDTLPNLGCPFCHRPFDGGKDESSGVVATPAARPKNRRKAKAV